MSTILREKFIFDRNYSLSTPVVMFDQKTANLLEIVKPLIWNDNVWLQIILAASILLISWLTHSIFVTIKIFFALIIIIAIWNIYYYIFRVSWKKGQVLNNTFKTAKK